MLNFDELGLDFKGSNKFGPENTSGVFSLDRLFVLTCALN